MIKFSSFNYVALLHSTLANISMPQSRGWGTMAAAGRRRPPWLGCILLFSHVKNAQCTDSYMKKGGQIKMSILTFFPARSRVDLGNSFGGHEFSRSKTRVDPTIVPAVNFPYQGLLVQTYIQCHGSYVLTTHSHNR
jgi:hypothetical protein